MSELGKPQPDADVVNKQPKTLLIGYGWVGQFIHKYFTEADYYTPSKGLVTNNSSKKPVRWDVAFISVPSPMRKDGSCNTSYVIGAVKKWHNFVRLFIIRSTVTPGTIDKLQKMYPKNLFVMQPEYIGETLGHPLIEPNRQTFIILGGTKEATKLASKYWSLVLHAGAKIRQVDAKTAEFCKYMENCFLATKVVFVNDWFRLCKEAGVDFYTLREAWLDDPRINRSHTMVYEDNPGFSGKCLPKDLNSITHYARKQGRPLELIESILKINAKMRKKK